MYQHITCVVVYWLRRYYSTTGSWVRIRTALFGHGAQKVIIYVCKLASLRRQKSVVHWESTWSLGNAVVGSNPDGIVRFGFFGKSRERVKSLGEKLVAKLDSQKLCSERKPCPRKQWFFKLPCPILSMCSNPSCYTEAYSQLQFHQQSLCGIVPLQGLALQVSWCREFRIRRLVWYTMATGTGRSKVLER